MSNRLALSITNADFGSLAAEIALARPGVDMLHVDVMDGHFVPNLMMGPAGVQSLRKHTDLYFDCHLMISRPGDYLDAFRDAGADGCSVHIEAGDTDELIAQMRDLQLDVGLGVNPYTPFEDFEPYLEKIDMLLVMTVVPGFGGQKFMDEVMPKLKRASDYLRKRKLEVRIEVDGGIDSKTVVSAREHGADTFVVGSSIFNADDYVAAAAEIRGALEFAKARE